MANINEIKKARMEKVRKMIIAGIDPYPAKVGRTHAVSGLLKNFSKLQKDKKEIKSAGRIRTIRGHGKATFFDIEDGTGKIQALLREDKVGKSSYDFFKKIFDIGDFILVSGVLVKTKTGEKTIEVSNFKMLTKALLPLPEKWHGLKDDEERYRKRYLDLIFNKDIKKKFEIRSKIIQSLREFLNKEGFLEVETPILQPLYGGAEAEPFKTHLNALDIDLYLRIAPELYLKRLLVGGFEKIFEIGKCFRNEGMDRSHNPDFTMIEIYWAFADYKDMAKLTEKMFTFILKKVFKSLKIEYNGKEVDFTTPWKRIDFFDLFHKETGINLEETSKQGLEREAKKFGIKLEKGYQKPQIADKIFKKKCQSKIWQPTFVLHYPSGSFPLSKSLKKNPKKLECFQLIVAGWELVKVFTELNNPIEQAERLKEQENFYKNGLSEAQRMDKDFIEAMEYGMPPAAGFGMGIDRLVALLTNSHSLREVILFPTMKPK